MTPLRIKFIDGYPDFSPNNNYIINRLRPHFSLELVEDPDFLFYSVSAYKHAESLYDHCVKIWYTEENYRPDFTQCDYALSFDYVENEPRHLRWPLYLRGDGCGHPPQLVKRPNLDATTVLKSKSKFCNFLYSNDKAQTRIRFFEKLSRYKSVDSGGTVRNNLDYQVSPGIHEKLKFMTPYKFTIAFENARYPGYTTEKLVEPMMVGSIPIYWGNFLVGRDFNTRSFVNCHDYATFEEAIDEIFQLDRDDGRYIARLKEPWLIDNVESNCFRPDYAMAFFERVFTTPRHPCPRWSGVTPRRFDVSWKPLPNPDIVDSTEFRVFE